MRRYALLKFKRGQSHFFFVFKREILNVILIRNRMDTGRLMLFHFKALKCYDFKIEGTHGQGGKGEPVCIDRRL